MFDTIKLRANSINNYYGYVRFAEVVNNNCITNLWLSINTKSDLAKTENINAWVNFFVAESIHIVNIKYGRILKDGTDGLDSTGLHDYEDIQDLAASHYGLSKACMIEKGLYD